MKRVFRAHVTTITPNDKFRVFNIIYKEEDGSLKEERSLISLQAMKNLKHELEVEIFFMEHEKD